VDGWTVPVALFSWPYSWTPLILITVISPTVACRCGCVYLSRLADYFTPPLLSSVELEMMMMMDVLQVVLGASKLE
jgi:hypothetical protein